MKMTHDDDVNKDDDCDVDDNEEDMVFGCYATRKKKEGISA